MDEQRTSVEEVYCSNRRECMHRVLVLQSAGIPCQLRHESAEFFIVVPAHLATRARAEIEAYARENEATPSITPTALENHNGWPGVFGYAGVLLLMFAFQNGFILNEDWVAAGRTHAGSIRQGEWWRTVTALTLHADFKHLLSNIGIGGLIGLFAGELLGGGVAWIGILFAGAAGNMLNAWVRNPGHTSIGASTAVFAAFGMIAAFAVIRRRHIRPSKFGRYTPIVGAVILLSFLGTSGQRTDVFAHVAGFLAGLLVGALYGKLGDKIMIGKRGQLLLGIAAVGLLGLTWLIALAEYKH